MPSVGILTHFTCCDRDTFGIDVTTSKAQSRIDARTTAQMIAQTIAQELENNYNENVNLKTQGGYEFPNLSPNSREHQGMFGNHRPIVMRKLARRLAPVAADGQHAEVVIQNRTASDG